MATNEYEITEQVDLCGPDGKTLNPKARGWSRAPMHTCNLRGGWGRTKRWDYWGILAGDLTIAATYADIDYLGIASVWWCDLASGRAGGRDVGAPLAPGFSLPDRPGTEPLNFSGRRLDLVMRDDNEGTHIEASWKERDGSAGHLDVTVALPEGHESLNVVVPWSDKRFQFTSKHQARPARGTFKVGDREWELAEDCWGVLDVGRGRWPYKIRWNWGGGAGLASDGHTTVGLQFGGKWTDGTGFTENGLIIDGRLHKIGVDLVWDYDWNDPMRPWHVSSPDGAVDVSLTPRYDKHSRAEAGVLGIQVHQVFGHWSGVVKTDDGRSLTISNMQGFAEESRNRW